MAFNTRKIVSFYHTNKIMLSLKHYINVIKNENGSLKQMPGKTQINAFKFFLLRTLFANHTLHTVAFSFLVVAVVKYLCHVWVQINSDLDQRQVLQVLIV